LEIAHQRRCLQPVAPKLGKFLACFKFGIDLGTDPNGLVLFAIRPLRKTHAYGRAFRIDMRGELGIERLCMSRKNDRWQLDVVSVTMKTCHDLVSSQALVVLLKCSVIKEGYGNRSTLKARHQFAEIYRRSPSISTRHELRCTFRISCQLVCENPSSVFTAKFKAESSSNEIAKSEISPHHLNSV